MEIKTIDEMLNILGQFEDSDRSTYTDWEIVYMLWGDKLAMDDYSKAHFQEFADGAWDDVDDGSTPEQRLKDWLETFRAGGEYIV